MDQYRAWAGEAVGALQRWYSPRTGLWKTAGWWNSANALTAVIQHSQRTGEGRYRYVIQTTFGRAGQVNPGFSNEYYDDDGRWALAWIAAFDLTGDVRTWTWPALCSRGWRPAGMTCAAAACGGRAGRPIRTRYRTSCSCSSRAVCTSVYPAPANTHWALANGAGSGPAA